MADLKFAIWERWAETFDQMDDETVAALFRAMYRYAFYGEEPSFEYGSVAAMVWPMMAPHIEKSTSMTRRNQSNGSKHVGKPTEEPTLEVGLEESEPTEEPTGKSEKPKRKPNAEPTAKTGLSQRKPKEKSGITQRSYRKEKNRREGNNSSFPEERRIIPTPSEEERDWPQLDPDVLLCTDCDNPMEPTATYTPGGEKRIFRCPTCGKEEAV